MPHHITPSFLFFISLLGLCGCNSSPINLDEKRLVAAHFNPDLMGKIKETNVNILNRSIHVTNEKESFGFTVSFKEYSYGEGEMHPIMKIGVQVTSIPLEPHYVFQSVTSSPNTIPTTYRYFI